MAGRCGRWTRVASAGLWVAAAAIVMAGCASSPASQIPHDAPSGGQTQAELDAVLETLPGLASIEAKGSSPNIKGNTGYEFDLTLETGYDIGDGAALVDFLARSAWSVRDGWQPNTSISISVSGRAAGGTSLVQYAVDGGWVPAGSQTDRGIQDGWDSVSIWVDPTAQRDRGQEENLRRLGDWPGEVPTVPDGVIVPIG